MARYGYTRISWTHFVGGATCQLWTTEPQIAGSFLRQAKKVLDVGKADSLKDPSGELCGVQSIRVRNSTTYDFGTWVAKSLCHQGWEPFSEEVVGEKWRSIALRMRFE